MKKLALVAALVLTLVSCNKKENTDCPKEDPATACTPTTVSKPAANPVCDELGQEPTPAEIDHWITAHEKELCAGALDECILKFHSIDAIKYDSLIKGYWATGIPLTKTFMWRDIQRMTAGKCYPKYIGFYIGQDVVTDLKPLSAFDSTQTCYSMPLFNAIGKLVGGLDPADTFTFTLAKVGQDTRVVFSVVHKFSGATFFFDISDNPTRAHDFSKAKL